VIHNRIGRKPNSELIYLKNVIPGDTSMLKHIMYECHNNDGIWTMQPIKLVHT